VCVCVCVCVACARVYTIILGGISAAVTTPFDVAKTRIMLANRTLLSSELKILNVLHGVYLENGFRG